MPIRKPSALIPLSMSFAAMVLVLGHVAVFGTAREADEGAAAHLWQLLMAGQMPVVAYFAFRWIPQDPGPGLRVLAMQIVAAFAACFPVLWFGL